MNVFIQKDFRYDEYIKERYIFKNFKIDKVRIIDGDYYIFGLSSGKKYEIHRYTEAEAKELGFNILG